MDDMNLNMITYLQDATTLERIPYDDFAKQHITLQYE